MRKGLEDIIVSFDGNMEDLENLKVASIDSVEEWKHFKERRLFLDFEIASMFLNSFIKYILRWNAEDKDIPVENRKPIKIFIDSPGGDLQACMTFIDILKMSKTPIHLICMSGAYSAAGLIFMCKSDNVVRKILPRAKVLVHQGTISTGQALQTNQFLDTAEHVKKEEANIKRYILENTNIDDKLYNRKKKNEWMLSSEECLKLGVCDEIVTDINDLI